MPQDPGEEEGSGLEPSLQPGLSESQDPRRCPEDRNAALTLPPHAGNASPGHSLLLPGGRQLPSWAPRTAYSEADMAGQKTTAAPRGGKYPSAGGREGPPDLIASGGREGNGEEDMVLVPL